MSTNGFAGEKPTGTTAESPRARLDEWCRYCGTRLRARDRFETETRVHQEVRCPGRRRDGCLSRSVAGRVLQRRGTVFSGGDER